MENRFHEIDDLVLHLKGLVLVRGCSRHAEPVQRRSTRTVSRSNAFANVSRAP
jgi:hypothetical protein